MRLVHAALVLAVSASPALAQRAPVIVIPGRTDVPVILNGVDVSYAVIEGEFGLSRPNMVNPTVIYRPFVIPLVYGPDLEPESYPRERHYFPLDRPAPRLRPLGDHTAGGPAAAAAGADVLSQLVEPVRLRSGHRLRSVSLSDAGRRRWTPIRASRGARPEPRAQCGRARPEPESS